MRVKATIEYNGRSFEGFQRQAHTGNTITSAIETALKDLNIYSPVAGSGRTDAGVHASGQVIHFDLPPFWSDLTKLKLHINERLYHIRLKHITQASDDFHAQYDAKRRIYRYIFSDKKQNVFEEDFITYIQTFDSRKIENALRVFEGEHDFRMFHKTGSSPRTTMRTIYKTRHKKIGRYHLVYFEANGFLRAQIRLMMGAVFAHARGDISIQDLQEQVDNINSHTQQIAPPNGLYLAKVIY
jgi:tRNA pseudouridine38-40 synthase